MKKQPKYYALFCLQTGNYMATGLNDKSERELKQSLISYLSIDNSLSKLKKTSLNELCLLNEFRIETQNTPYHETL